MTPEDLANRHPELYHLTAPEAVDGIRRHGLLPPLRLLDLFEADPATRALVLAKRATSIRLAHPDKGEALVTDNAPLDDRKLASVLDDGLSPDDWRRMLAERVFLWTDEAEARRLAGARLYRGKPRVILVFGTLSLARAHAERIDISPFNTGSTLYVPARRGRGTFAPLLGTDWEAWRRRRAIDVAGRVRNKAPDRIKEVTVRNGVPDAARHLIGVRSPSG